VTKELDSGRHEEIAIPITILTIVVAGSEGRQIVARWIEINTVRRYPTEEMGVLPDGSGETSSDLVAFSS
jgi:hypothetical protein